MKTHKSLCDGDRTVLREEAMALLKEILKDH
jgi:hypothetical protein